MGRAFNSFTKDRDMKIKRARLRIHREEIERIYNLKFMLEPEERLAGYAGKSQEPGLGLAARQARSGAFRRNVPVEMSRGL